MCDKRTALQCQARGCDGCVVCDRVAYSLADLETYREREELILERCRIHDDKMKASK